jgi:chemotaxis signal transduction protein
VSGEAPRLTERAETLRRAFDAGFAEAARRETAAAEKLLAFDLGPEPYALRLSEIAGLFADRKVTRLPGAAAALLGLAGFRGAVVPVFDLHALLGRPGLETPRWLAVASAAPVAFAFETFAGHLRVPREAVMPRQADGQARRPVREVADADGRVRSIVHLASVLEAIPKQRPGTNKGEER